MSNNQIITTRRNHEKLCRIGALVFFWFNLKNIRSKIKLKIEKAYIKSMKHIVLVDDEVAVLTPLTEMLESESYKVSAFQSSILMITKKAKLLRVLKNLYM